MKIGVLTYHAACNYGANLQALSTISYLRNRGYEPIVINWMTKQLENRYRKKTPPIQYEEHKLFRERYFPMTNRCYTGRDIANVVNRESIDAIIVGSDAVMQTNPFKSRIYKPNIHHILPFTFPTKDTICPNPFWGSFYKRLKRDIPMCFMSASSQNSPYMKSTKWEKEISKRLLEQFSYISTRDDWTSKMVGYFTDGTIIPPITPDPVFAFNFNVKEQPTEEDIRRRFNLSGKYCLVSYHQDIPVTETWLKELEKKQNQKGVECVAFPFPQGIEFNHPFEKQIDLPLSPLDWYALIKYADSYIGANMHPIVICLHNAVPCFSFDHYGIAGVDSSSKIYHIMNHFGILGNRIAYKRKNNEVSVEYVLNKIDSYDKEKIKKCANDYLKEYLKMMNDIEKVMSSVVER